MKSSRILLDTCIYIGWLRGWNEHIVTESRANIVHFSGIVYTELLAGAFKPKHSKHVKSIKKHFDWHGRFQEVTKEVSESAGEVLRKINKDSDKILADTLIAMSAREIGAEVWTHNAKDFEAIKKVKNFKLRIFQNEFK
ncbi:MAG: PIN domain-containing protein [Planctomycetes bacterium]|nr:PIN domain-containing protein [Planctomycetota bacterium]